MKIRGGKEKNSEKTVKYFYRKILQKIRKLDLQARDPRHLIFSPRRDQDHPTFPQDRDIGKVKSII